ncbi:hybrid sensor histidine kinase/response regulator [Pseudoalteromonas sp. McH1-7]|uniref:hybrid sensor histidine kinase/response regulator n=1 Tax=Pseudoalteromonas TaxID=53246 RepID=UPI001590FE75|nr:MULTISPECIES: hybrid sensor histidine kinase/response regulator [Pseudoalteromonas]MDW7550717.1 hybrid sensor histidine kinase/response regulator [Pseudoalteromonas peptidolytica]NUZ12754.1 hybrid sensor histidine kinase/response regulator [Pseudoalteromonas sp. McH1-7]USD29877.1 hybrid sensor histidine kinase/response regulator [Pseudoalteromonas sp. SCSIO 43201]
MADILIVDDMPENLQVLQLILRKEGFKVLAARGGDIALSIVKKHHPALIVTDIKMPNMSGIELCKTLKSNAVTAGIPVVFVSAYEDSESLVQALSVGGVDYITKPYKPSEIIARVNTQFKLIEAQKLAVKQQLSNTINQMMIGIAHELNTPLGTSITSSSYLKEIAQNLQQALTSQTLTQAHLVDGFEQMKESCELCIRNLEKVAKFVSLLKSISQSERGCVRAPTKLFDIENRLRNSFSKQNVKIEFITEIAANLYVDGQALLEVFENLIENSIAHAWCSPEHSVTISCQHLDELLHISYIDYGVGLKGISTTELLKPFITTKRGNAGHVGLSANLTANLISGALQGEFDVDNTPLGLEWRIRIPVSAPDCD